MSKQSKQTKFPDTQEAVSKFEAAFGVKVVQMQPAIIQTQNGNQWRSVADYEELRDLRILGERVIQTGSLCWCRKDYQKPE